MRKEKKKDAASKSRDLFKQLYPGENFAKKYREFQTRKLGFFILITVIGAAAAFWVHQSSQMHSRLAEGTYLFRNEWGEGNYSVILKGTSGEKEGETVYEVKERIFTPEERLRLKEELFSKLPEMIAGENESLSAVNKDLNLITQMPDYPFTIVWQSGDYERIKTDGRVNTANIKPEGEKISLTAICSYEEDSWEWQTTVTLVPRILTPTEQYLAAMREELAKNDKIYQENYKILLPEKIGNEEISWEEKRPDNSILLFMAALAVAAGFSFLMDKDLEKRQRLRQAEIKRSYPEFVSRLRLYMGAGLSAKNAFLRIGKDYQREKQKTGKRNFLYEEVLIGEYQLANGKSEQEVYREWGKRCGEMQYRKFSFLLNSHLQQGNDKILSLLSEEADAALEDRKNTARKRGEEAGTKLLLPMMIMLVVVMFLILLPVFSGFGTV